VANGEPITKEIFIDATPEEIFPYLTQADKYVRWMGLSAELDARPGGIFKVDPNTRDVIYGEFPEVVPPTHLVFTWGWKEPNHPVPAASTRVEIERVPQGGGTLLRLRHHGVAPQMRQRHQFGWAHYLVRLKILVDGSPPGPDPYADPNWRHS
jgi:uncharacterized protein YndB with AHSA1/START domain